MDDDVVCGHAAWAMLCGPGRDWAAAHGAFARDAAAGDAEAMCGLGVARDEQLAAALLALAAEQGGAVAQSSLGACYARGTGVEKDERVAAELYSRAAGQGYAVAQTNLGACAERGHGVPQDARAAVEWHSRAAEQGLAQAQFSLGVCCEHGRGTEADIAQALVWYTRAVEQGHAAAQCNLGTLYANGTGVAKDERRAAEWYKRAAEQAYAPAQFYLGMCYENGLGVERDKWRAVEWFGRAAAGGHAQAKQRLERLRAEHGDGGDDSARPTWMCAVRFGEVLALAERARVQLADEEYLKQTAETMVQRFIRPATEARRCRYTALLPTEAVGAPDVFVSHRWASPFHQLLENLRISLGDLVKRMERDSEAPPAVDDLRVWLDIFAVNQHDGVDKNLIWRI